MIDGLYFVFDIENKQDHYAKCLHFMEMLEGLYSGKNSAEKLDEIKTIVKQISIYGAAVPDTIPAKNYFEEPLVIRGNIGAGSPSVPLIKKARKLEADRVQPNILEYINRNIYHIRIHFSYNPNGEIIDIMNLRFLVLLLQRMEFLIDKKHSANSRMSVFIVPSSGEYFPFQNQNGEIDTKTYKTISAYLRLISKAYMGVIYGVTNPKGIPSVRCLNFRNSSRFTCDFPLTPIEKNTYEKLFDCLILRDDFKLLLALREGRRFRNASNDQPQIAFTDYLMEASVSALKNAYSHLDRDSIAKLEEIIQTVLFEKNLGGDEGLSLLAFALFCFTFSSLDFGIFQANNIDKLILQVRTCRQRASDLSEGIRQIAQNALQHSQTGSGVFSFSLLREKDTAGDYIIRMALCDYNSKTSFVDTFVQGLEREKKLGLRNVDEEHTTVIDTYYDELIENHKQLRLKHFFSEYGKDAEIRCLWEKFRRSDIFAHVGLLLFSAAVHRYRGAFSVSSNQDKFPSADNWYHCDFSSKEKQEFVIPTGNVIPGTQFLIEVPNCFSQYSEDEQILGLAQLNRVHESYHDFARYISTDSHPCSFSLSQIPEISKVYCSAADKFKAVQIWRSAWIESATKAQKEKADACNKVVFYWDMEDQECFASDSSDEYEAFWKGFVSALDILEKRGVEYIAITNLSKNQINIFRSLCCIYILKAFPNTMQVYLCQKMGSNDDLARGTSDKAIAIHLFGDTYAQAIQNAYCLSVERGTQSFSNYEVEQVDFMRVNSVKTVSLLESNSNLSICPFDAILPYKRDSRETLFDRQVELMAEKSIDKAPFGYKIADTHMQLGNKIHIRSFYEMAFLFYRTSIANRIAFELLRELKEKTAINLIEDTILFYGYASYSKALLTSIVEILKFYRVIFTDCRGNNQKTCLMESMALEKSGKNLAIATYQHNLQSESKLPRTERETETDKKLEVSGAEKIQLYFDFPNSNENKEMGEFFFKTGVKLIQIVPISSTLTTFEKMYARILRELMGQLSSIKPHMELFANLTAFWVTDATENIREGKLSEIEKNYIEEERAKDIIQTRCITTKLSGMKDNPDVHFLMQASAIWDTPLRCSQCYPENPVMEIPLVSVDQTSTVPTQQIRAKREASVNILDHNTNNSRLLKLQNCIWKGHILREKNHFNYYIDTQKFFTQVRYDVADWLAKLPNNAGDACITPLNIIFSPEHPTNIGFAQYVNNYYFKGNAEIVCLNEDKEFRSNFCCEHRALQQAIKQIFALYEHNQKIDIHELPVKFHFVDDTIISGSTFFKANSFLHSLLPDEIRAFYPTNLIDQCFVLVDRLSVASKQNYVKDVKRDFHSFVHLDISNARTQGDSCNGCKRVQNAVHLFKRSATRLHAMYWFREINNNAICSYDDSRSYTNTVENNMEWRNSGRKALLSHIAQNVILNASESYTPGVIYDSILALLSKFFGLQGFPCANKCVEFEELIENINATGKPVRAAIDLLNLISRPFFTYDFKCRYQVQTMLIIFAECMLFGISETEKHLRSHMLEEKQMDNDKKYLLEGKRFEFTVAIFQEIERRLENSNDKIEFLDSCLFLSLTELQSTYLIRKSTFSGVYRFIRNLNGCDNKKIEDFLVHYASYIHYLLDSNTDETRSLWLEHLLTTGVEYPKHSQPALGGVKRDFFETIVTENDLKKSMEDEFLVIDQMFSHFCDQVFLQNTCIIYDGIENTQTDPDHAKSNFIEYWKEFRSIDGFDRELYNSEKELFNIIKTYAKNQNGTMTVEKKYDQILNEIQKVAEEKYKFNNIRIALLTCSEKEETYCQNKQVDIRQLDFVASGGRIPRSDSWNRHKIKDNLVTALNKTEEGSDEAVLLKYGYQVGESMRNTKHPKEKYLFVYFDNPDEPIAQSVTTSVGTSVEREKKRIVKVFLYFSAEFNEGKDLEENKLQSFKLRLFLRDILSYRHLIMTILENDFAGDIFAKYAHTSNERSILAHEKVNSHNTSSDDRTALEVLALSKTTAQYEILDSAQVTKWLLLRNYTNGQIAKLFNRSFSRRDEERLFDRGDSNVQAPPLYISKSNAREEGGSPDRPLIYFHDLEILEDARFALLEQAIAIQFSDDLNDAEFICNQEQEYYNVEYMKCVLIDSLFSAMKYYCDRENFLPRLDHCLKKMHLSRHKCENENAPSCNVEICVVKLTREPGSVYDYLVIQNDVDYTAHNLFDICVKNKQIKAHLSSPTDFFDGHMSLLAIKEYIEGIHQGEACSRSKADFFYKPEDDNGRKVVRFYSKLPILKKEIK